MGNEFTERSSIKCTLQKLRNTLCTCMLQKTYEIKESNFLSNTVDVKWLVEIPFLWENGFSLYIRKFLCKLFGASSLAYCSPQLVYSFWSNIEPLRILVLGSDLFMKSGICFVHSSFWKFISGMQMCRTINIEFLKLGHSNLQYRVERPSLWIFLKFHMYLISQSGTGAVRNSVTTIASGDWLVLFILEIMVFHSSSHVDYSIQVYKDNKSKNKYQ